MEYGVYNSFYYLFFFTMQVSYALDQPETIAMLLHD